MKLNNLLMISILAIISIIAFSNKLNNEFVWDDHVFIKDNLEIMSLKNIPSFFSEDVLGIYRPLRTTLYAITYYVSGLNPAGYHLIGLAMHISVVILIFLITLSLATAFESSVLNGYITAK